MFEIIAYNSSGEKITPTVPSNLINFIKKNKRYAIILENGIDLALLLIEIYKKGAISVPIMPSLRQYQIDNIINHADVDGIILRKYSSIILIPRKSNLVSPIEQRFLIYTSGSTGAPKGVIQNQASVEHNAKQVIELHNFSDTSPHATCLPLYHCNALMMSLIGCYLAQCPLILLSSYTPNIYFSIIEKHNVATASIVPALLPILIKKAPKWPSSLQYLISAAAPLTQTISKEFFKLYGPKIRQGYGLSEAVNFSFVTPLLNTEQFVENYIWQKPPVGIPVKETQFKITSEGEVLLKGPNLMVGYWLDPKETKRTFTNGWLKTGDLGIVRGDFLVLTGRKKEIINRGGETRLPLEIEEMYQPLLPKNTNFIVVPTEHKILDNEIGVILDTSDPTFNINIESILDSLDSTIVPAVFAFKRTSKTSTGKSQRLKDGKDLFCYQQGSEQILSYLLGLRIDPIIPSNIKLELERSLQHIIPKKHQITNKSNNLHTTFDELIYNFIEDALIFQQVVFSKKIDISSDNIFRNKSGIKIHYLTKVNESRLDEALTELKSDDLIMYIQSPDKIIDIKNPFKYIIPDWVSNKLPEKFNFKSYWLTVSPIKFKKYKFINLILIGKNE